MRTMLSVGGLLAVLATLGLAPFLSDDAPPIADYVVHEWGTFTSMQGSAGGTLQGLQHEEEELPDFVYSRAEVRACPLRDLGYKGLEVPVTGVTQKMETPVTYFYAREPVRVRARVGFEGGILSQWFPVVERLGPPEAKLDEGELLDLADVERSFLEWNVDVLPIGEGLEAIPEVEADDPWSFARLPDSSVVRSAPRPAAQPGPSESEKYLFYRGLGRFEGVLKARAMPGAVLALENTSEHAIEHLFLVHVRGGRGEFREVAGIGARETRVASCPLAPDSGSVEEMLVELFPALEARLVDAGLNAAEARAMVLTWEQSYFHTEGLRTLYVVPRPVTDAILPLELEPRPRELERVLVGRLECLTPESEAEVLAALRDMRSDDPTEAARGWEVLVRLGRFREPYLRRARELAQDPAVREFASQMLPD
ncbi:MAG: hypothetical protein AAF682_07175 [Planctomycetota bacterium]